MSHSGVLRGATHGERLLLACGHGESSSQTVNEEDRLPTSVSKESKAKQVNYLMSELGDMQDLPGKDTLLRDSFFEQFLESYGGSSKYFKETVCYPATAPSKKVEMSSGGSLLARSTNPSGFGGTSTGS